jgi:glycosyltransferase involved in cell wall biosynthesis
MKVVFIFGKGIDGCGVTRGALIFEKWLVKNGHETSIVSFDNGQTFGRSKDSNFIGQIHSVEKKEDEVSSKIIEFINNQDIAIFHSHPTSKQFNYVERYRKFIEQIKNPIKVVHDHAITKGNMGAIPQYCEIFSHADIAVTQSFEGFAKSTIESFDGGLKDRVIENPIWLDTSSLNDYWTPFNDRKKQLIYMGRMSSLKDPAYVCRIEPYLPDDWQSILCGCERSISSVSDLTNDVATNPAPYMELYTKKMHQWSRNAVGEYRLGKTGPSASEKARIVSYDSYEYGYGMKMLGESVAAWCGYKLGDVLEYGHRMEYTIVESMLLSLPIINRHFAENARSPEGKLWKEYYGPLISQATEEKDFAEELVRISNDTIEWTNRTNACKEIVRNFNEIEIIGEQFFNQILKLGKRKDNVDAMEAISTYFPQAKQLRNDGEIIVTTPNSFFRSEPKILDGRKSIIYKPKALSKSNLESFF